jgi:ABC-2 type transport system ATP-binding protein
VKTLSKGMKTKLYLLLTLAKDVDVLLLDEPTLGLDIVFRQEFYNLLLGEFFDENKTVIISTHQVAEVENILHDVIFIDKGKIVLHQNMQKLKEEWSIVEMPADKEEELKNMNAKSIVKSLGKVRGIVNQKIVSAHSTVPSVSDIFVASLGQKGA